MDKQVEFQVLHPNIRTMLDDLTLILLLRRSLEENAKHGEHAAELIKILDDFVKNHIQMSKNVLTRTMCVDKAINNQAN